mgnify:CR=1 FL=1
MLRLLVTGGLPDVEVCGSRLGRYSVVAFAHATYPGIPPPLALLPTQAGLAATRHKKRDPMIRLKDPPEGPPRLRVVSSLRPPPRPSPASCRC